MKLSDSLNEKLINLMAKSDYLNDNIKTSFRRIKRHHFLKFFYISEIEKTKKIILDENNLSKPHIMKIIYSNNAIPTAIKNGKLISSISQPSMNAFILKMMRIEQNLKVLEIGSGTGWLSALISQCMQNTGKIIGIEMIQNLVEQSREAIKKLDIKNIQIINKDGSNGHKKEAPYDRIVFTAACNDIPDFVYEQLTEGGLVLLPLIGLGWNIFAVMKKTNFGLISQNLSLASFVPLYGEIKGDYKKNKVNQKKLADIELNKKISVKNITKNQSSIENTNFKLFLFLSDYRAVNFVLYDETLKYPIIDGFGLYDEKAKQYCIIKNKTIYSYGNDDSLLKRLILIINSFIEAGKPTINDVNLIILKEGISETELSIPTEKALSKTIIRKNAYLLTLK